MGVVYKRHVKTFKVFQQTCKNFQNLAADFQKLSKTSKTFKLGNNKQEPNLIDAIKISCRKLTKEKTGKKPFTNINIARI